jgi:hypothetical protein
VTRPVYGKNSLLRFRGEDVVSRPGRMAENSLFRFRGRDVVS